MIPLMKVCPLERKRMLITNEKDLLGRTCIQNCRANDTKKQRRSHCIYDIWCMWAYIVEILHFGTLS